MTGISTYGSSLDQIERLKDLQTQLATFQRQLSSGKKTDLFSGLGTDVLTSKRSRADFSKLETFVNNIDHANRRMSLMTTAMQEIKQQAGNLSNAMSIQVQQGEIDLEAIGDLARNLKNFLVNLMNEKDGDRYIFAGADTLAEPVADSGGLETYLQTQLGDWVGGTIDTDALIASYRDTTQLSDSIVGFSASLSSGNVKDISVRVDDTSEVNYTVLANDPAFRDILVATSMIDNIDRVLDEITLDPDDPLTTITAPGADTSQQNDRFYQMFNDVAAMMSGAIDGVDQELFKIGQAQAQTSQIKLNHELEQNTLKSQISQVEDADMNEVAVSLNSLQVQLEASFRVTAAVRSLSLVNFL